MWEYKTASEWEYAGYSLKIELLVSFLVRVAETIKQAICLHHNISFHHIPHTQLR